MNITRNGKIARLPYALRNRLNLRLQNGECARTIVNWLNARPDVKAILKQHFAGKPIRQQNLSEWRLGGYQDWLDQQQFQDLAHTLSEDATDFTGDHPPLTDTLNHWLAARLTLQTRRISRLADTDPGQAYELQRAMIRDVATLQRAHTQARREQRHREQLAFRQDQLRQETEAAREQTIADHEAWALHPANQDRLWRALVAAYPNEYTAESDDPSDTQPPTSTAQPRPAPTNPSKGNFEDDIDDESEEDFDDTSSAHSESGPAVGTVIPSEVESRAERDRLRSSPQGEPERRVKPHTSAPASAASPHQSAPKNLPLHSKSSSHQPSRQAPSLPRGTTDHQSSSPPLPPAVQAAIHEQLSTTRTELRILRLRMGLPPDPVPVQSRREAVSCL